jgi:zinc transport system ATP-binding protein
VTPGGRQTGTGYDSQFMDAVARWRDVSYAYGTDTVLEDVSFEVRPGEFVALVGPNGSGKSTLLRLLVGLLRPQVGEVLLFGDEPSRLRQRHRLGFVPQRPTLAGGLSATVEDVVAGGRLTRLGWHRRPREVDREAVHEALEAVALDGHRHERMSTLSGGQQQRAFIARALAGEPDFLVLDEPVAGVDAESQRLFRQSLLHLIRHRAGTVLLVSHELGAVGGDLDRVVVLKRHVRFDGPPAELSAAGVSLGVHRDDLPLWLEGVV